MRFRTVAVASATGGRLHGPDVEIDGVSFDSRSVQPGQLFVALHDAGTNRLTFPVFDPLSRQPGYKHCAVRLEPTGAQSSVKP